VHEWGCLALGTLARNDANCVSIAAKYGIEAILSAMTAHSNVSRLQECGCAALGNLAGNYDANRESIAAKHGVEAVVSAMYGAQYSRGARTWFFGFLAFTLNKSVAVWSGLEGGLQRIAALIT
jgi:hypothetical protein